MYKKFFVELRVHFIQAEGQNEKDSMKEKKMLSSKTGFVKKTMKIK